MGLRKQQKNLSTYLVYVNILMEVNIGNMALSNLIKKLVKSVKCVVSL